MFQEHKNNTKIEIFLKISIPYYLPTKMSRNTMKTPFDLTKDELTTVVKEVQDLYTARITSKWMKDALITGLNFETFRAFNAGVFKVSQDIKHATRSETHNVLWKTPKPFVSAKRLLGWIITGKDFLDQWASYATVLGASNFHLEVANAFLDISEGNNFSLAFLDAAEFSKDSTPEGDLVPVLSWTKPKTGTESGPYKDAVLKTELPAPASQPTTASINAGAGGGASWAEMAMKPAAEPAKPVAPAAEPATEVVKTVAPVAKEEFSELSMTAAIMLLQTLVGKDHALTYKTIDALAEEVVKAAKLLVIA